jgi:hypothetical protein
MLVCVARHTRVHGESLESRFFAEENRFNPVSCSSFRADQRAIAEMPDI